MNLSEKISGFILSLIVAIILMAFPTRILAKENSSETIHIKLGADSNACGITVPIQKSSHKLGLIIWLHGGMRSANREKGYEAHRAILPFIHAQSYYLASPSAFGGEDWITPKGQEHIENLITYLLSHYPIDSTDINFVAVSDGTLGLIVYSAQGHRTPHRRVLISTLPQIVLPIESLSAQTNFKTGTWDFFQGGHDRLFPSDQTLPYLKQWETLFPNAHLHYYPEGEHDFSFYAAHSADLFREIFNPVTKKTPKVVKSAKSEALQNPH